MKLRNYSENEAQSTLPKLLGNRHKTPQKESKKIGNDYLLNYGDSSMLSDVKRLHRLATDWIRENTIESINNGDNKIILRSSKKAHPFEQLYVLLDFS
jgi:hypothetical protein